MSNTEESADSHKYQVVEERLLELVRRMSVGDRLPTERALADEFGVSRTTIRQSITGLERSGRVRRVQGSGTYVTNPPSAKAFELTSFSNDMRARGLVPGSRVLNVHRGLAGADMGKALDISPGAEVVRIERVRLADGQPMCIETVHLPLALVEGLDLESMEGSLYQQLATQCDLRLVEADQIISATVLDERQAELLECPVLSPALVITRVSYDWRHIPVEHAVTVYLVDRYDVRMNLRPAGQT